MTKEKKIEGVKRSSLVEAYKEQAPKFMQELAEFIDTLPPRSKDWRENLKNRIIPTLKKYNELEKKYPAVKLKNDH